MSAEASGCLGLILRLLGGGGKAVGPLPYMISNRFMTAAEISFFHVLRSALPPELTVCPKVRLGDVLLTKGGRKNQGAANKVNQKHLDFLICDLATMTPRLAIELDDASHDRADRKERDAFLDAALQAAGLPILHVPAARGYAPAELRQLVLGRIKV